MSFDEDCDDFAVVFDVIVSEDSIFAVLEPFLRGLISTDVEVPRQLGNILEALRLVDENFTIHKNVLMERSDRRIQ